MKKFRNRKTGSVICVTNATAIRLCETSPNYEPVLDKPKPVSSAKKGKKG